MNPTFDFGRWALLVRQHWIENKKRYMLSMLAAAGLLFMWFFFIILSDDKNPLETTVQRGTYFFLLFVSGCFYASQFYRELGSRSRAINFLLTPASSMEKLLVSLLYGVVLFFIVYTAIFYLVDFIMVTAANAFHPSYNAPGTTSKAALVNVFGKIGRVNGTPFFFAAYFAVQSVFLLGSIYYAKYSFVKTVISLFLFILVIYLLEVFLLKTFMPEGSYHRDIFSYLVYLGPDKPQYLVELPNWIGETLSVLIKWGIPIFFWGVAFFRLKEKEV